jgi:hypothetical protein
LRSAAARELASRVNVSGESRSTGHARHARQRRARTSELITFQDALEHFVEPIDALRHARPSGNDSRFIGMERTS